MRPSDYKLLIFDWDGTLADSIHRIVEAMHGLPDDWPTRAAKLGADVPACVTSKMCLGHGTGTELSSVVNDLEGTPVLLVNPRVPLATGPVFAAWDGQDRGSLPEGPASQIAAEGRNDLEAPAIALVPQIAEVLDALPRDGLERIEPLPDAPDSPPFLPPPTSPGS